MSDILLEVEEQIKETHNDTPLALFKNIYIIFLVVVGHNTTLFYLFIFMRC